MDPEKYTRACDLFLELAAVPTADRDARLSAERDADPELFEQVVALLEGDARRDLRLTAAADRPEPSGPLGPAGLRPGAVVADYRLVECIGEGGMGQVWEAEQQSLGGRRVALKFVRPDRVSAHQLALFAREARAGGRLQHPGIVTVFNSGASGGLHWIAMELVAGGRTLKDLVNEAAARPEVPPDHDRAVARLVAEIADAMQAAHEAGVVHRDLKPRNVLITPDGRPRVMDFGIARIVDETGISVSGDVAGTYFYMSPEQVVPQQGDVDARADVFALGVVLYELLALRRPFQGDTPHLVVRQILVHDPPDPRTLRSRIPADLAVIAGKALEKSPARRYASMSELAADLRRHLNDEPIRARPPTWWYRAFKWARRNPTKSVAGGVTILALAIIAGFVIHDLRRELVVARQGADLGRLLELQEDEDLVAAADRLWPIEPELIDEYEQWIARASELVARLHPREGEAGGGWIAELEQVRARAIPWDEVPAEEKAEQRRSHPRFAELEALRDGVEALRHAQSVRAGAALPAGFELVPSSSDEIPTLALRARALTEPQAPDAERAAEALAWTRRALELVEDDESYAAVMEVHAWAAFRNGLDEEALESARELVDASAALGDPDRARRSAQLLERIGSAVAGAEAELSSAEARLAELEAEVSARRSFQFRELRDRLWHAQLVTLIAELEALADPRTGLLGTEAVSPVHGWSIPKRLALATRLREDGPYALRWSGALAEIRAAHPELDLSPLTGLVPIGRDPRSGLFEFWHVMSGAEPLRSAAGELDLSEESGLVLVLIPGGSFSMGAQSADAADESHDSAAGRSEWPVHRVTLSPFLIAKHEMTQGQWERVAGENPSFCNPTTWNREWNLRGGAQQSIRLHPVEQVTWARCETVLARMGLVLPTEGQWEHAARAGTAGPWWSGEASRDLDGAENLADGRLGELDPAQPGAREPWNDGFALHAPVGSFRPNPFGLFDVLGNVFEWCRDGYAVDAYVTSAAVDPFTPSTGRSHRVSRGGSWKVDSGRARVTHRGGDTPHRADSTLGVRPALDERSWRNPK